MKEILTAKDAVREIKDGSSIMVGGFMCAGQSLDLIDALIEQGTTNLTIICNDAGLPGIGVGKLINLGRVSKLIASHIGLNPVAGQKMNSGEMIVELVPQGSLAEKIRASGAGLGGVITPTGLGTEVEKRDGVQKITIDNREFLVEKPLKADFAFIKAHITDKIGNAFIEKSAKNFNTFMATAADVTLVETDKLVNIGDMDPDRVNIPSVFTNKIIITKQN